MFKDYLKQQKAQQTAEEDAAFEALWVEFPDLKADANKAALQDDHHSRGGVITLESLREAAHRLVANGTMFVKSASQMEMDKARQEAADAQERKEILGDIAKKLRKQYLKQGMVRFAIDGAVMAELRNRYSYYSLEELRAQAVSADEAKRLRGLSREQLQQEAIANAESTHGYMGVPSLPAEYTRERLLEIIKSDKQSDKQLYRHLGERYGQKQINDRLGYVAQKAPGVVIGGTI